MLDHLVFASPDPTSTRRWLAAETGVELSEGGPHVGFGTRNWLGSLGDGAYLELIGPDADQPDPDQPRPFGVDDLTEPTLVTWCVQPHDLDALRTELAAATLPVDEPIAMTREAPSGLLSWRVAQPAFDTEGGTIPFFIDWQGSPHPSTTAAGGLSLSELTATHPDPDTVVSVLALIGAELPVEHGEAPGLRATITGPSGSVVLR